MDNCKKKSKYIAIIFHVVDYMREEWYLDVHDLYYVEYY